jgi:hypothetical protein
MLEKPDGVEMQLSASCYFLAHRLPLADLRKQPPAFSKATPVSLAVLALFDFLKQLLGFFFMLSVVGELYRQVAD